MPSPSVCAVVVTFNRKNILIDCLFSLIRAERQPDKIVVVDNASTDGTADLVRQTFPQIFIVQLAENTGCAGGFKAGIAAALLSGCALIWLMDDDHVGRPDTLLRLSEAAEYSDYGVFGCVLLSPADERTLTSRFVVAGRLCCTYQELLSASPSDGFIRQTPTPFNGVLYRSDVLRRIGLPDERLFIRGDELDYWLRLQQANIGAVIVVAARMSHPSMFHHEFSVAPFLPIRLTAHYTESLLKNYCLFRNRAFCFKKYKRYRTLIIDIPRYVLFFVVNRRADIRGLAFWVKAYLHGLLGIFGYERRYLSA